MIDILVAILMVVGAFFMLIASVGLLRMPDLYMRMSANTKSVTLGVGILLLALALYFGEVGVASRALATIAFLALTIPISSHLIGRAAYLSGVELWEDTIADELRELYSEPAAHSRSDVGDEPPHRTERREDDVTGSK